MPEIRKRGRRFFMKRFLEPASTRAVRLALFDKGLPAREVLNGPVYLGRPSAPFYFSFISPHSGEKIERKIRVTHFKWLGYSTRARGVVVEDFSLPPFVHREVRIRELERVK